MPVPARTTAVDFRTFRPGDSEKTLALRQRLRNAQTIASAKAVQASSDTARAIFWLVAQEASRWTFAVASDDDLEDVANALVRMFLAASAFERIES